MNPPRKNWIKLKCEALDSKYDDPEILKAILAQRVSRRISKKVKYVKGGTSTLEVYFFTPSELREYLTKHDANRDSGRS